MNGAIKITLSHRPPVIGDVSEYRVESIQNAILATSQTCKVFRVGDVLTEAQAVDLQASRHNSVKVVYRAKE